MRAEHIELLKCPISGEELRLVSQEISSDGHIKEGKLISSEREYPIVEGIPRFIFEKSYKEDQTVRVFGNQWNRSRDISFKYGQNKKYFASYFSPLNPEEFRNTVILDAGCGNGRLIEYSLKFNPKIIIGIDYSNSVELAFKRTRNCKNVMIIQGTILMPPLKNNSFDYIYSLGVIHHLIDPPKGIRMLSELLKYNARSRMHIWIYSKEGNELYLLVLKMLRKFALKFTEDQIWILSNTLAYISFPYLWLSKKLKALFKGKTFLPLQEYLSFIYNLGFDIYKLVIHDQLVPSIAYYPSRNEVLKWIEQSGLVMFHLDMRTNNSWRIGLQKKYEK